MWPIVSLGPLVNVNATPITLLATGFADIPQGGPLTNFQVGVASDQAYYDTATDLSAEFTDYGVEIVWGQSVTWYWNRIGTPREQRHQIQSGIPTSGDGETLFVSLNVVNQQGSSWHTVWNGSDSDAFEVAAIQVYAR